MNLFRDAVIFLLKNDGSAKISDNAGRCLCILSILFFLVQQNNGLSGKAELK